ncbi:hypothetical protein ABZ865_30045 [Streptomyces sp. NPDC047085]|uniref:hypothetical protein n=1 Tax=Streptomyces sp. NPDC047085 TaxID=3155140 RepID=UPI003411B116
MTSMKMGASPAWPPVRTNTSGRQPPSAAKPCLGAGPEAAREGHLKVEGLDHRGQKLFRHLDVARAEMATRAKAKRMLVQLDA